MSDCRPIIFIDGITEAQVANGVARITLVMTGKDGRNTPCGMICIPIAQLPNLVSGLSNLLKQIELNRQIRSVIPANKIAY